MMKIPITIELTEIFKEIIKKNLSIGEWSLIESGDMFQTKSFTGGYDSTEQEFVFSYFGDEEYWFQVSLDLIKQIIKGEHIVIIGRPAIN